MRRPSGLNATAIAASGDEFVRIWTSRPRRPVQEADGVLDMDDAAEVAAVGAEREIHVAPFCVAEDAELPAGLEIPDLELGLVGRLSTESTSRRRCGGRPG